MRKLEKLRSKFTRDNRYSNFGDMLDSMDIEGFRGIDNATIDFNFPITVITGLNGTGKSTIAQLAACGYKALFKNSKKRYNLPSFFPVSEKLDPKPFSETAKIKFKYIEPSKKNKEVTVARDESNNGWRGYMRQPERYVNYIGMTIYLPKFESRDFSLYRSTQLELGKQRIFSQNVKEKVSHILKTSYESISFQEVVHKGSKAELGLAKRFGSIYSENHMGFGEGRLLYIVDALEKGPMKSLFILEEPETSLNPWAQMAFCEYLIDVCLRKGHQIIITTHSENIINKFPNEALQFVKRTFDNKIKIINGISANYAQSLLSDGLNKSTLIAVEDRVAKNLIEAAILKLRPAIRKAIKIAAVGNTDVVREVVKGYSQFKDKRIIGIRDADKGEDRSASMFKLPGSNPPEMEIFNNYKVQLFLNEKYDINCALVISQAENHHDYISAIANSCCIDASRIEAESIDIYLSDESVRNAFDSLFDSCL